MKALERANEVRLARARIKRAIASGEITVASVLLDPPEEVRGLAVSELLAVQRRWGASRTARLLSECRISEWRQLRSLTERQRRGLAEVLTPSSQEATR